MAENIIDIYVNKVWVQANNMHVSFTCIVDPSISETNEKQIKVYFSKTNKSEHFDSSKSFFIGKTKLTDFKTKANVIVSKAIDRSYENTFEVVDYTISGVGFIVICLDGTIIFCSDRQKVRTGRLNFPGIELEYGRLLDSEELGATRLVVKLRDKRNETSSSRDFYETKVLREYHLTYNGLKEPCKGTSVDSVISFDCAIDDEAALENSCKHKYVEIEIVSYVKHSQETDGDTDLLEISREIIPLVAKEYPIKIFYINRDGRIHNIKKFVGVLSEEKLGNSNSTKDVKKKILSELQVFGQLRTSSL